MRNTRYKMQDAKCEQGFSIIEVLIAITLVGIAIASLLAANISFSKANSAGAELSNAEFLLEQIKELTILLPVVDPQTTTSTFGPESAETLANYDDLDDFDNANFAPPIGSSRAALNNLAGFSQQITVENVSPTNFGQVVSDHSSVFVRVTVKVFRNSYQLSSASWIRARY